MGPSRNRARRGGGARNARCLRRTARGGHPWLGLSVRRHEQRVQQTRRGAEPAQRAAGGCRTDEEESVGGAGQEPFPQIGGSADARPGAPAFSMRCALSVMAKQPASAHVRPCQ